MEVSLALFAIRDIRSIMTIDGQYDRTEVNFAIGRLQLADCTQLKVDSGEMIHRSTSTEDVLRFSEVTESQFAQGNVILLKDQQTIVILIGDFDFSIVPRFLLDLKEFIDETKLLILSASPLTQPKQPDKRDQREAFNRIETPPTAEERQPKTISKQTKVQLIIRNVSLIVCGPLPSRLLLSVGHLNSTVEIRSNPTLQITAELSRVAVGVRYPTNEEEWRVPLRGFNLKAVILLSLADRSVNVDVRLNRTFVSLTPQRILILVHSVVYVNEYIACRLKEEASERDVSESVNDTILTTKRPNKEQNQPMKVEIRLTIEGMIVRLDWSSLIPFIQFQIDHTTAAVSLSPSLNVCFDFLVIFDD